MFQDITTLLLDPKAFKDTIDLFVERYKHENISVIAGTYYIVFLYSSYPLWVFNELIHHGLTFRRLFI